MKGEGCLDWVDRKWILAQDKKNPKALGQSRAVNSLLTTTQYPTLYTILSVQGKNEHSSITYNVSMFWWLVRAKMLMIERGMSL